MVLLVLLVFRPGTMVITRLVMLNVWIGRFMSSTSKEENLEIKLSCKLSSILIHQSSFWLIIIWEHSVLVSSIFLSVYVYLNSLPKIWFCCLYSVLTLIYSLHIHILQIKEIKFQIMNHTVVFPLLLDINCEQSELIIFCSLLLFEKEKSLIIPNNLVSSNELYT